MFQPTVLAASILKDPLTLFLAGLSLLVLFLFIFLYHFPFSRIYILVLIVGFGVILLLNRIFFNLLIF